jgi:hypothetical protein
MSRRAPKDSSWRPMTPAQVQQLWDVHAALVTARLALQHQAADEDRPIARVLQTAARTLVDVIDPPPGARS